MNTFVLYIGDGKAVSTPCFWLQWRRNWKQQSAYSEMQQYTVCSLHAGIKSICDSSSMSRRLYRYCIFTNLGILAHLFWKNKRRFMTVSCCLCICVSFPTPENGIVEPEETVVPRQGLGNYAATITQARTELLDAVFFMRSVSYQIRRILKWKEIYETYAYLSNMLWRGLGSEHIHPRIFYLGIGWRWASSRSGRFITYETTLGTHRIGSCLGPRTRMSAVEKRKVIAFPARNRTPSLQPSSL
jgi:hypothetical protein